MYISSGDSFATVDVNGAYLRRLTLGGIPILKETGDLHLTHGGMALLAPYANRIRDGTYDFDGKTYTFKKNSEGNSIHGFAKESTFKILRRTRAKLMLHSLLSDHGYPGKLDLLISYVISPEKLEVRVRAENASKTVIPFQLGFHPYFLFDGRWGIESSGPVLKLSYFDSYFPDGSGEFINPNLLNSDKGGVLDNCFWVDGDLKLSLGSHDLIFKRDGFPFLQFYNGKYTESRSIAIEPMTAPPDCFNNGIGLKIIPSGKFETFSFSLELLGGNNK